MQRNRKVKHQESSVDVDRVISSFLLITADIIDLLLYTSIAVHTAVKSKKTSQLLWPE